MSIEQIKQHGGKLINRIIDHNSREKYMEQVLSMTKISINLDRAKEIENVASGLYSPLEGFLGPEDYKSVLESKRLANGLACTRQVLPN